MSVTIVLGVQWGDEGKGKLIDVLSSSADYVIRYNGGNNAGHTVVNKYGKFSTHLVPSGIFSPKTKSLISNGAVIDLEVLAEEIKVLKKAGLKLEDRFFISPRCHLIMPYHKLLDKLFEEAKGKAKTGTTGRGIGPVYADKVSYNGIRISDFLDRKKFIEKLNIQLPVKNKILKSFGQTPLKTETIEKSFAPFRKLILPYVKELFSVIHKAVADNKEILFEGAQAVFLDTDWGTYPFVTASSMFPGAINAAAGIPPKAIGETIGVAKAYTTRVGDGPFPTELLNGIGEKLRSIGAEFGATTGRPRRCGWFDAELVRFAAEITGLSSVALTKIDVLDEFEEIKICIGYEINKKKVRYYEGDESFLGKVKPIYKIMKGWQESTKSITKYEDLPKNAKIYIKEIEKQTGVPIKYISTGAARDAMITR